MTMAAGRDINGRFWRRNHLESESISIAQKGGAHAVDVSIFLRVSLPLILQETSIIALKSQFLQSPTRLNNLPTLLVGDRIPEGLPFRMEQTLR